MLFELAWLPPLLEVVLCEKEDPLVVDEVLVTVETLPLLAVTVATTAVAVEELLVLSMLVSTLVLFDASMLEYEPVVSVQL